MKAVVELSEEDIREAICDYVRVRTGVSLKPSAVKVQVKSQQNWKSEWELAHFRAHFEAETA